MTPGAFGDGPRVCVCVCVCVSVSVCVCVYHQAEPAGVRARRSLCVYGLHSPIEKHRVNECVKKYKHVRYRF